VEAGIDPCLRRKGDLSKENTFLSALAISKHLEGQVDDGLSISTMESGAHPLIIDTSNI
jgi:hypothetical protein